MISNRYLSGIAVILALGCVPTVVHTYIGMTATDGRTISAIPARLAGMDGRPTGRSEAWVRDAYGTTEFIERHYGPSLTLFVARSFDPKALYHHPEHGVAHGDSYGRVVIGRRPGRPEVPIFRLEGADGRVSVYALTYDGAFVQNPIRFQLRSALRLMVRPRAAMTLFFVRQRSASFGSNSAESLLLAAIDSFTAQSRKPSP